MAFFRGADYDIGHYLVVAVVRKILAVIKQATQRIDAEIFSHRKAK